MIQTHPRRAARKKAAGNLAGTAVALLVTDLRWSHCLLIQRQSEADLTGRLHGRPRQAFAHLNLLLIPCLGAERNPETRAAKW